jgi:phospholipase/carboxylesterase
VLTYHLAPPPAGGPPSHYCLILHGLGDTHQGWLPVVPMLGIPRLACILADAPRPYGDGFSWFDIAPDRSINASQVRDSRRALEELISHLLRELGIASQQLFLMGFSQGALMVMDAALRSRRPYAGVVAISGFLALLEEYPLAFGPAAAQSRLLMTHGRQDQVLPFALVQRQVLQLQGLGVAVQWQAYDKAHTLDTGLELAEIRRFLRAGMLPAAP